MLGTADYQDLALPTKETTVGPDAFDGVLLTLTTVIDLDEVTGLSDSVILSSQGGSVDVFLGIQLTQSSGLVGFDVSIVSFDFGPVFTSGISFDVPFLDEPGRTGSFGDGCQCVDLDGDSNVDLADFGAFQPAYSGLQ